MYKREQKSNRSQYLFFCSFFFFLSVTFDFCDFFRKLLIYCSVFNRFLLVYGVSKFLFPKSFGQNRLQCVMKTYIGQSDIDTSSLPYQYSGKSGLTSKKSQEPRSGVRLQLQFLRPCVTGHNKVLLTFLQPLMFHVLTVAQGLDLDHWLLITEAGSLAQQKDLG